MQMFVCVCVNYLFYEDFLRFSCFKQHSSVLIDIVLYCTLVSVFVLAIFQMEFTNSDNILSSLIVNRSSMFGCYVSAL